jgi:branched-chain amino acid transport system permease protein
MPPISAWAPQYRLALRYWHASVWISLLLGILSAMLLAGLIGALAIRKRGVYFAMSSLAFGQMLYFLALSPLKHITRGEDGLTRIPIIEIFSISLNRPRPLYYFVMVITVVMLYVTWRILQSPFGKLLQAFRENEDRAKACGFNTTMVKFFSLVMSAFYGGLASS